MQRQVPSLSARLESWWLAVFFAFLALSNTGLVLPAYILLLLYGAATVVVRLEGSPPLDAKSVALLAFAGIAAHLPLSSLLDASTAPLATCLFAAAAAVAEEVFYRGLLLERLGLPVQALVFMYSHLTVTDPLFLVNSSLLAPHYFLFGLASGLVAEKKGFEGSSVLHAAYNVVAVSYTLPLSVRAVLLLVTTDALLVAVLFKLLR